MAKATILLVDNDHDFLEASSAFLQGKGYQVIATHSLQEAKKKPGPGKISLAIIEYPKGLSRKPSPPQAGESCNELRESVTET